MNNHRRLRNRIINEEGLYPGQEPTDEDYADYRRMERESYVTDTREDGVSNYDYTST